MNFSSKQNENREYQEKRFWNVYCLVSNHNKNRIREHATNPLIVILTCGLIYSLFACYNVSVLAIFLYFVQFPHACLAFSLQRSNFLEIFLVFMVLIVSFTVKAS